MGGSHDSELTSNSTPNDVSSLPELDKNSDWLDDDSPEEDGWNDDE